MQRRGFLIVVLTTLTVVALLITWFQIRETRGLELSKIALAQARSDAEAAIVRMRERLKVAEEKTAGARAELAAVTPTPGPVSKPAQGRAVTQSEVIAKNPRVQLLRLKEARAAAAVKFSTFFRAANLSPAQIERFLDNLTGREERMMDLQHTVEAQGLTWNDPALAKLSQQVFEESNAVDRENLGPDGYKQLLEYNRSAPLLTMLGQFASSATIAGVPYTPGQIDQLTKAFLGDFDSARKRTFSVSKIDWARVDALAAQILSPAQMDVFAATDPSGGGGRYWMRFSNALEAARKADAGSN